MKNFVIIASVDYIYPVVSESVDVIREILHHKLEQIIVESSDNGDFPDTFELYGNEFYFDDFVLVDDDGEIRFTYEIQELTEWFESQKTIFN